MFLMHIEKSVKSAQSTSKKNALMIPKRNQKGIFTNILYRKLFG